MGRLSWEATRGLPYDATPDVSQSIAVRGDSEPVIGQVYGRCGVWGYPAFGRLLGDFRAVPGTRPWWVGRRSIGVCSG